MKAINLKKKETVYLDENHIYMLEKGKLIIREVFVSGKIVSNECPIERGEIVGNLFSIFEVEEELTEGMAIEIEALEDSVLTVANFGMDIDVIKKDQNNIIGNMLRQILKKNLMNTFYHLYDKKGYILSVLRLYADSNGMISKKTINPEIFNLSRSQFYAVLSEIKNGDYIIESGDGYKLNKEAIKEYLLTA